MQSTTPLCCLPSDEHEYKWPRLDELHEYLFGEAPERDAHNALNDMRLLRKCFVELLGRGFYDQHWRFGSAYEFPAQHRPSVKAKSAGTTFAVFRVLFLLHVLVLAAFVAWKLNHPVR